MRPFTILFVLLSLVLGAAASAGGMVLALVNGWLPAAWFAAEPGGDSHAHDHGEGPPDFVTLTPQAQANLRLDVKPVTLGPFERTITVPAQVAERPGQSDAVIAAPAAGIVTRVTTVPGESVTPGTTLFTLHLIGEELYDSQKELFKATRDVQITQDERQRLDQSVRSGGIPATRLLELDYQLRRLNAALDAARHDLVARGLKPEQIQAAAEGKLLSEMTITVPEPAQAPDSGKAGPDYRFDIEGVKVHPGEKVQAGQALAVLSNHQVLDIEGHAFRDEAGLLRRAAVEGWPVAAEFPDEKDAPWTPAGSPPRPSLARRVGMLTRSASEGRSLGEQQPERKPTLLTIRSLSNTLETGSQSFAFRLTLPNEQTSYSRDGKTYRVWRFRPGQRVQLRVPVEEFKNVIVLPAAAVVHEAAEVFVFRQSGDSFQRRPVRVLYEDRTQVVIANDGSINVGDYVARNGAAQLNRALKSQAGGEGGDAHHHHHHH